MTLRVVMKIIPVRNKDAQPGVSCGLSGRDWPVSLQAMTIRLSMYKLFSGSLQREDTPAGLLWRKAITGRDIFTRRQALEKSENAYLHPKSWTI